MFVIGVSNAFFSDTETSRDNTFAAGELDLKIDNTSYYNGVLWPDTTWSFDEDMKLFFNFMDLKPGDYGEDTISLHVQNDAYVCMSITKTADDDVTCTEPERSDDPTCSEPNDDLFDGELGGLLQFIFWADDGDNVLEDDETVFKSGIAATLFDGVIWPLADSSTNIWNPDGGPMLASNPAYYIGKAWCFGTLTQEPLQQDGENNLVSPANTTGGIHCNGTWVNNAAQTDMFMADIEFSAVQARHNDGYLCNEEEFCYTPGIQVFASSVESYWQGPQQNGQPVAAARSIPTQGLVYEAAQAESSFFSLGFGGWIIVSFTDIFVDGPGVHDLKIIEDTWGSPYPIEKANVSISQDGVNWTLLGEADNTNLDLIHTTKSFDLAGSGLDWAKYVKIEDTSDISLFGSYPTGDGYDLNAVEALSPGYWGPCITVN